MAEIDIRYRHAQRNSFLNLVASNQIWIVGNCSFLIELAQDGITFKCLVIFVPFDAKSIGKGQLKSKFSLIYQDSEKVSLCVAWLNFIKHL